ncbi:metal-dependent phosphohydrolase [Methylobacterium sp. V23]|nr:metal-dependent phosphohydrolase [Methylobacterium sp. V23]
MGTNVAAILLLTDMPTRSRKLASLLEALGEPVLVDLLDPAEPTTLPAPESIRAVVSDASLSRSTQVAALRRHLGRLGPNRPPFLCLMHEDTPRARVQAQALGANRTLSAGYAARSLAKTLEGLFVGDRLLDAGRATTAGAAAADVVLTHLLDLGRAGTAPTRGLVRQGAELVLSALDKADVRTWLDVVWRFDDATHQHCLLVAGLAAGFARHLGMREADCHELTQAALLHDLGKSRIPLSILNKPGRLDDKELAVMRTHPTIGYDLLRDGDYPEVMLTVVRSHHEALDGSGYPDNLRSDRIPDLVRLVTVCDMFGALIERRPYKKPLGGDEAYATLQGMDGKIDIDLVRAFQPLAEAAGAAVPSIAA